PRRPSTAGAAAGGKDGSERQTRRLCSGPALVPSGSARWSCGRELIWSLGGTLPRGHSTVCADRNRWGGSRGWAGAPGPAGAWWGGGMGCVGGGGGGGGGWGAGAGGRADGQRLGGGPLREGLHADRSEHVIRSAQLRPRLGPPVLAT